MAIFHSNDMMPKNGDMTFKFRQNSDVLHLCGIDQEETILLLFPDCPNPMYREMLFIMRTNEHIAIWEGHKYTKEEAAAASGIDEKNIYWADEFDGLLNTAVYLADNIYLNLNENDRQSWKVPYKDLRFAHELMQKHPLHNYERSAPIMQRIRAIKHDIEIDLMQHACNITEKTFRRVMKFIKPGVMEYEIEAEIMHEFLRNRSNGPAYDPIIASGYSACVLHYVENNKECKDGDMILMDFGADYANYASDLTRTIPVNGRFTQRQKGVYNAVLRVMREATKMLTPGNRLPEYHAEVGKVMEGELLGLGLISKHDIAKQDPSNPAYKKYFMHGTSHFMGIDTHDYGMRWEKFEAGMIFSCEPGIYIPAENLGIRIENDIVIKENGQFDLMANIPIEVEEIEDIMNS